MKYSIMAFLFFIGICIIISMGCSDDTGNEPKEKNIDSDTYSISDTSKDIVLVSPDSESETGNYIDSSFDSTGDSGIDTTINIDSSFADELILTGEHLFFSPGVYILNQENCSNHSLVLSSNTLVQVNINDVPVFVEPYTDIKIGDFEQTIIEVFNDDIEYYCY